MNLSLIDWETAQKLLTEHREDVLIQLFSDKNNIEKIFLFLSETDNVPLLHFLILTWPKTIYNLLNSLSGPQFWEIVENAVNGGNIEMLDYLDLNESFEIESIKSAALDSANIDSLKWIIARGARVNNGDLTVAINHGQYNIADILLPLGLIPWEYSIEKLICYGPLKTIKLLFNNVAIKSKYIERAIKCERLDVLDFFRGKGAKYGASEILYATNQGKFKIANWLFKH